MIDHQGSRLGVLTRRGWLAPLIFALMTMGSLTGYRYPTLPRDLWSTLVRRDAVPEAISHDSAGLRSDAPRANEPRSSNDQGNRGTRDQGTRDQPVESMTMFGSEVMLVVTAEEFFEPHAAKAIREVVDELRALPQVSQVTWIDNAPPLNIFGLPEPALPDYRASPARFSQAKAKALTNPMILGQFLSADAKTLVLLLDIDWFYVRSDEACTTRIVESARQTMLRHPDASLQFSVTGNVPMRLRIGERNKENDRKFQYICYLGVLLMAVILFRSFSAVVIAALPVAIGIFWSFGFIRFLDMQENPFNFVVVPVLLSMVGFTDSVHLIAQIRVNRTEGLPTTAAVSKAMDQVGAACFLTSLTTAIGFASLWWAHHKVVQEFGICCVVGASVMFVAVVTTIPIACRTWLGRGIQKGEIGGWIERHFHRFKPVIDACIAHHRPITLFAVLATLLTGLLTLQLKPDERLFSGIPEGSSEAIALRHMDRAMGGLEISSVVASWPSNVDVTNEEIIEVSQEVESILKSEPMLGSPLGLSTIVDALPGEGTSVEKASLLELLPPPLKQVFWKPAERRAMVVFRLQDRGIASYGPVFERISQALAKIEADKPGVELELEGTAVQRWRNLYRIIVDLAKSLGTASIVIFLVLGVFYRSIRLGLIAIIPNLFPLTVTGAAMWFLGQPLELVSVLAFTVCLGIAVDDTIHFVNRYREEMLKSDDEKLAIERAAIGVGAAMTMTTVVLLAGFGTVLLSDSRDHHIFAMMGASTIGMAIVGDLIFLPAMLMYFPARKRV